MQATWRVRESLVSCKKQHASRLDKGIHHELFTRPQSEVVNAPTLEQNVVWSWPCV
jgi:hypothetical protein